MFIKDDKLPDDVLRKTYSETPHALYCLECSSESEFDPTIQGSIGRPLDVLLEHDVEIRRLIGTATGRCQMDRERGGVALIAEQGKE
jgi:hypothetical protein